MTTIKASHYGEDEKRLMQDPIIIEMADDLRKGQVAKEDFFHQARLKTRRDQAIRKIAYE